jgi:hypothetical protein
MPGYLTPAQPTLNSFTPTGNIQATTIADAIVELDNEKGKVEQVVRVYDDATARNTAISSPTEGMVTYLKSLKTLNVYNGTNWIEVSGSGGNLIFLAGT